MDDITSGFPQHANSFLPSEPESASETGKADSKQVLGLNGEPKSINAVIQDVTDRAEQTLHTWATSTPSPKLAEQQFDDINQQITLLTKQLNQPATSLSTVDDGTQLLPQISQLQDLQNQLSAAREVLGVERSAADLLDQLQSLTGETGVLGQVQRNLLNDVDSLLGETVELSPVLNSALDVLPSTVREPIQDRLEGLRRDVDTLINGDSPQPPKKTPDDGDQIPIGGRHHTLELGGAFADKESPFDVAFDSLAFQALPELDVPGEWSFSSFTEGIKTLHSGLLPSLVNAESPEMAIQVAGEANSLYNEIQTYLSAAGEIDRDAANKMHVAWLTTPLGGPHAEPPKQGNPSEYADHAIWNGAMNLVQNGAIVAALTTTTLADTETSSRKAAALAKSVSDGQGAVQAYPHFVFLLLQGPKSPAEVNGKDMLLQKAAIHDIYLALDQMDAVMGKLNELSELGDLGTVMDADDQTAAFSGLDEAFTSIHGLKQELEQAIPEDKRAELHALTGESNEEIDAMRQKLFIEHVDFDMALSALSQGIQQGVETTFGYLGGLKPSLEALERAHVHPNALALTLGFGAQFHEETLSEFGIGGTSIFTQGMGLAKMLNGSTVDLAKGLHDLIANMPPDPRKDAIFEAYSFIVRQ